METFWWSILTSSLTWHVPTGRRTSTQIGRCQTAMMLHQRTIITLWRQHDQEILQRHKFGPGVITDPGGSISPSPLDWSHRPRPCNMDVLSVIDKWTKKAQLLRWDVRFRISAPRHITPRVPDCHVVKDLSAYILKRHECQLEAHTSGAGCS